MIFALKMDFLFPIAAKVTELEHKVSVQSLDVTAEFVHFQSATNSLFWGSQFEKLVSFQYIFRTIQAFSSKILLQKFILRVGSAA